MEIEHDEVKTLVQKALCFLDKKGEITWLYEISPPDRWIVEVDGKYFGIYDTTRKTFVD